MPIIRNPFRRQDENARPNATVVEKPTNASAPPKSIDLGEKQDTEYKLSGRLRDTILMCAHVS
jgi:hypothetical protein